MAQFYFATCQFGVEKIVKKEVLENFPELKFAFSRPGFVTFKNDHDTDIEHRGIFTRHWGQVIGQAKSPEELKELLGKLPKNSIVHAFDRDFFVPGDEPDGFEIGGFSAELVRSLPYQFRWNEEPAEGEAVLDLIWVDDFHVFLGKHIHSHEHHFAVGNIPVLELPEESPSRAYLKIEEAIYRFNPPLKSGMQVLEVGCSPGGATTCMLSKGLKVTGIDPKFMADELYDEPNFRFIQKLAKNVTPQDLKENPDWIVMDMNIAPLEALDELTNVLLCLRKNFGKSLKVKQGFLTIKLNDLKFADSIPLYLKRIEEMGFRNLTPIQLCSNRQEFFVAASGFN